MKSIYIFLFCILATFATQAQLRLRTQSQVNGMAGITKLGWVIIQEDSTTPANDQITDLTPMQSIDSLGTLEISETHLENLTGLENIKFASDLNIYNNSQLKSITTFSSLEKVLGMIIIGDCPMLDSISSFEALKFGEITISHNPNLKYVNLEFFQADQEVTVRIYKDSLLSNIKIVDHIGTQNNYILLELYALEQVYINGNKFGTVSIGTTSNLPMTVFNAIKGFSTIDSMMLNIVNVPNLSDVCDLTLRLNSGDMQLSPTSIFTNPNGQFQSFEDIQNFDCSNYTGIEEATYNGFLLYPNPVASGEAVQLEAPFTGTVFNSLGQPVLQLKNEQSFSTSGLGAGLYVLRSVTGETSKLVVSDNGR